MTTEEEASAPKNDGFCCNTTAISFTKNTVNLTVFEKNMASTVVLSREQARQLSGLLS